MLDRLKGDDQIKRTIGKWDCLGVPGSRVDSILSARVLADFGGDIDSHHACGAGLGERGSSIAFAAGDIEDSLAEDKVFGETVACDMLPEDPAMRVFGHHSLGVVRVAVVSFHASHSHSGL